MNKSIKSIYANIYKEPTFKSELVNQSLYFDKVQILKQCDSWSLVKLYDGYQGWVHSFYLSDTSYDEQPNHMVDSLYSKNQFSILSFGTTLPIMDKKENKIKSINPTSEIDWYLIDGKSLVNKRKEVVNYAKQFLGVPYLWGGRSSFGIDCSGLIQLIFHVAGIKFPRDTFEQINFNNLEEVNLKTAIAGDLVFFANNSIVNHVGLYIGNNEVIHSSGQVRCESFNTNANNYSKKLKESFYKVISITNLICN